MSGHDDDEDQEGTFVVNHTYRQSTYGDRMLPTEAPIVSSMLGHGQHARVSSKEEEDEQERQRMTVK